MKCPICGEQTTWQGNPTRPFCSERCRMIDLGKWIDGDYAIPETDSEPEQITHAVPELERER